MKKTLIGLLLFLFMVSCTGRQSTAVVVPPTITPSAVAITPTSTVSPTNPPDLPVMPVPVGGVYYKPPTDYDSHEQWWLMTENGPHSIMERFDSKAAGDPVVSHDHSLAVYSSNGDIWIINLITDEQKKLTNLPQNEYGYGAVWPPDDRYIVYDVSITNENETLLYPYSNIDLWQLNVQSGENINLTSGLHRLQTDFDLAWQSNSVLFLSWKRSDIRGNCFGSRWDSISRLTQVHFDGSNYKILDPKTGIFNRPSVSSDGNSIAYDFGHIYRGGQITTLNPKVFGLNFPEKVALMSPAWSPDGTELSWVIVNSNSPIDYFNIAIFDLADKSAKVVTQFSPYWDNLGACQSTLPVGEYVHWSPDGKWLAVSSREFRNDGGGMNRIRIFNKEGDEMTTIDDADNPFWSPDGKWLAFNGYDKQWHSIIKIVKTGTWKVWQLDAPTNSMIIDW